MGPARGPGRSHREAGVEAASQDRRTGPYSGVRIVVVGHEFSHPECSA